MSATTSPSPPKSALVEHISAQIGSFPSARRLRPYFSNSASLPLASGPPATWSTAGILGPVVVNYMHDTRLESGIAFNALYAPIFMVLAGLLLIGFVANLLVKPVAVHYYMTDDELVAERKISHEKSMQNANLFLSASKTSQHPLKIRLAWLAVLVPIAYGIWMTVQKAWGLFH